MRRLLAISVLLAGASIASATPAAAAPTGFSVNTTDDQLYSIDLATATETAIGPTGFTDVSGLGFAADGTLFGVDDASDQLITLDTASGAGTAVAPWAWMSTTSG